MVEMTVSLADVWHVLKSVADAAGRVPGRESEAVRRSLAVAFALVENRAMKKAMRKSK